MVLFSSSAALIQFQLLGRVNAQYAAVFGAASALSSLVGVFAVAGAVRRSGRPSLVVFALVGVMAAGVVVVGVFGLQGAVRDVRDGNWQMTGPCSS